MDVVDGLLAAPPEVQRQIAELRDQPDEAEAGDVRLPIASVPRTVLDATMAVDDDWWAKRAWSHAKELHGGTLIDVPRAARAAFADYKLECIEEVEKAEGDRDKERAWMKLSFVDALVLNSVRPQGESQAQSVTRRICQARDGQWEPLWREATAKRDLRDRGTQRSQEEQDASTAARVEDMARAGQASRAAKAANQSKPPITDKARLAELQELFPRALYRGDGGGTPHPGSTTRSPSGGGATRRARGVPSRCGSASRPPCAAQPDGAPPDHWGPVGSTGRSYGSPQMA